MTRRSVVSCSLRLPGLLVSTAALILVAPGCGEEAAPTVAPAGKAREEASTKNMENFMKGKPAPIGGAADAKKPGAPQTK